MAASSNLRKLSSRLKSAPEQAVKAGASVFEDALKQSVQRDAGSDQRLSGAKKNKLATATKTSGGEFLATATVQANKPARAQWSWLEKGTSPHTVGKKHMLVGGAWKTGPWRVGGSPSKRTFSDAVTQARSKAVEAMKDVLRG